MALPLLLLVLAATGPHAGAESDAGAWTATVVRTGPNPGDEARATLTADGQVTLHAVRMVGKRPETFDRQATLPERVRAALAEDLRSLGALDLAPPADPLAEDEAAVLSVELKCGERTLRRAYGFRHMYEDLPDHAVVRCLERYLGLDYWHADHLMQQAATWQVSSGDNRMSLHYARLAFQILTATEPEECERAQERVQAAGDREKKGDLLGAWVAFQQLIREARTRRHEWWDLRGIADDMPKASETARK